MLSGDYHYDNYDYDDGDDDDVDDDEDDDDDDDDDDDIVVGHEGVVYLGLGTAGAVT